MKKPFLSFLVVAYCFCANVSMAQQLTDSEGKTVTPYYFNFNTASKTNVLELRGEFLHLQYSDAYGKEKSLPLMLRSWDNKMVSQLSVNKEFGLNYFDINLKGHGVSLAFNETYACILTNENGKSYEIYFKYLPPLKKVVSADIMVNPKYLECKVTNGVNLVEFYGSISGGKAPYSLNWYVLNSARTKFLYQPSQVILNAPGYSSSIQVDESPEYFVLLYVKDACGNEQTTTVQVLCDQNQKKINTVFFQSLDKALTKPNLLTN